MMSALSWFKRKTERQLISYQCPCIAAHDSDKCAIWSPETMSFHPQMWQVSEQISSSLSSRSERLCATQTHTFHAGISSLTTHACLVFYI